MIKASSSTKMQHIYLPPEMLRITLLLLSMIKITVHLNEVHNKKVTESEVIRHDKKHCALNISTYLSPYSNIVVFLSQAGADLVNFVSTVWKFTYRAF